MMIFIFILASYILILLIFRVSWNKALRSGDFPDGEIFKETSISIIIPVRNEADHIGGLLKDLAQQTCKDFQIIVVDDHSEDNTVEIVQAMKLNNLLLVKNQGSGKKQAITSGIAAARGAIIITTDGDCNVEPGWLDSFHKIFSDPQVKLCVGMVRLKNNDTLFYHLQAIEFCSLMGTTVSMLHLGKPVMCNGANLAFRKEIFNEVNGYEGNMHIPSGDDEFLMRKIHQRYPGGIALNLNDHAIVSTIPQSSIKSFFNQRIRWAGKWRFNTSLVAKLTAVYVLMIQVSFLGAIPYSIITGNLICVPIMLMKMLSEALLLTDVNKVLRQRWKWKAFFMLQLIYPLYVIVVGIVSNVLPYQWKGRSQ